ncbi:hypothetical protein [Alteriqipengyuania sp. 357]
MQIEISRPALQRIAVGVLVVLLVLAWAWWDGGEEPLRPMSETIALPEVSE